MSDVTRILMTTWRRQGRTFGPVLRDMYGAEVQYVHAIQRAGGQVFLAPHPGPQRRADDVLDGFDGLVLIGGEDLAAEVSGADPFTIGQNADADRDRWEIAVLRAALAADLPVLAICRGLQILNSALGGTLHGDIAGSSPQHPPVPAELAEALAYRHGVELEPESLASRAYGVTRREVNSLHHQAVDAVGAGLVVTGHAGDGCVEAVELPSARWCLGVQWHPELLPDEPVEQRLFEQFVAACAEPPALGTQVETQLVSS